MDNYFTVTAKNESVILLHGLGKTERCMKKLGNSLNKLGYHVINCRYPSFKFSIEELAEKTINDALRLCPNQARIHFVTHSMGGILVRIYLQNKLIDNLGRVVMLGPPNKGSQLIDLLQIQNLCHHPILRRQAGLQLSTDNNSVPNRLGKANFELGIIAGTRSVNPILSMLLPGKNDGKVSVVSSKLQGMKDHLIMPVTHPFMMKNRNVIHQVHYFLEKGLFLRN
ncbi:MAG: hypothetical protein ACJAT7_000994 [Psychromonas sp.]|jgi:hypothetical protein|uniref:esterase/lipase family protein n=1 Tax=Psychromonas sp. TaxID=1884585 RepID=UPI0039E2FBB8